MIYFVYIFLIFWHPQLDEWFIHHKKAIPGMHIFLAQLCIHFSGSRRRANWCGTGRKDVVAPRQCDWSWTRMEAPRGHREWKGPWSLRRFRREELWLSVLEAAIRVWDWNWVLLLAHGEMLGWYYLILSQLWHCQWHLCCNWCIHPLLCLTLRPVHCLLPQQSIGEDRPFSWKIVTAKVRS